MGQIQNNIVSTYGNRLRVRVMGLCFQDNRLLMIKHSGLSEGDFWAPPGGGMDYGLTAEENLIREFMEETGLDIEVKRFLFTHEFLKPPLHGIELFFEVAIKSGTLDKGKDPEMTDKEQIIAEVVFLNDADIAQIPEENVHNIFSKVNSAKELLTLNGYFKFVKNR